MSDNSSELDDLVQQAFEELDSNDNPGEESGAVVIYYQVVGMAKAFDSEGHPTTTSFNIVGHETPVVVQLGVLDYCSTRLRKDIQSDE